MKIGYEGCITEPFFNQEEEDMNYTWIRVVTDEYEYTERVGSSFE